ncbi:MAG: hypothetical protein K2X87_03165 [Gemmataceae bacterium]|nr:hypothetical protein [Gemmataceae bacterium]
MAVRLLIAVLMLAGPIPANACTCAASGTPTAPAEPTTVSDTGHATGCGCQHPTPSAGGATAAARAHADRTAEPPASPDRHDRDCPAVNPRPVASATAPTWAAEPTADLGVVAPSESGPPGHACQHVTARPGHRTAGPVPLYLSLLSLRI